MGMRVPAAAWIARCLLGFLLLVAMTPGEAAEPGYQVTITGKGIDSVEPVIREVSELVKRASEPPPPAMILRQRAERDRATIDDALRALGYYDAQLTIGVDAETQPARVTIEVEPGPRYSIGSYQVTEAPRGAAPRIPIDLKALGMAPGSPAVGSAIVEADHRLEGLYGARGYPFAKLLERKVVIDHAAREARISVTIDPGPPARVGPITISGLQRVDAAYVRRRVPFKTGEPLTTVALEKARTTLLGTGLFSSVRVDYQNPPGSPDAVPVTITLVERPHHSVSTGVSYSTNFGPGANATWEDRNLFHDGERLTASGTFAQFQKLASLNYRQPDLFADPNQALLLGLEFRDEKTESFDIRRFAATASIERHFLENWRAAYGLDLEESHVLRHGQARDEHLIGFPLSLTRETTDSLLDPTRGERLILGVAPYLPVGAQPSFMVLRARQTAYQRLDDSGGWVAAAWAELGGIIGDQRDRIPFSKRFYAGGGGSVRGYGYQLVGPVDAFKDPFGGASEIQLGSELRIRITDNIGLVPFVEAGNVYASQFPDFRGHVFVGGGVGLRYYTAIGPLRLDLATPFYRRAGIDDAVQLYVSLGQAF
jgi:translocation and assembly module TamA